MKENDKTYYKFAKVLKIYTTLPVKSSQVESGIFLSHQ